MLFQYTSTSMAQTRRMAPARVTFNYARPSIPCHRRTCSGDPSQRQSRLSSNSHQSISELGITIVLGLQECDVLTCETLRQLSMRNVVVTKTHGDLGKSKRLHQVKVALVSK